MLLPGALKAQPAGAADHPNAIPMDSVQISLLTCSPGKEIWAQYGHTALRVRMKDGDVLRDMVVNYGMFSSHQPYFIPRFIFGLTDYKMDVENFDVFCAEYIYEGRGVTEQVLNITPEDKQRILSALQENIQPENVVYRYNFFYDNCTSRARDMIVDHLDSKVTYPPARKEKATFRDMIHEFNSSYPWASFGEDLLLGVNADRPTTKAEQQFLPDNLRKDFEHALYRGESLVKSTTEIIHPTLSAETDSRTFTPADMALLVFLLTIVTEAAEYRYKKFFWGFDVLWMIAAGAVGIVLTMMIFSQHPCVSLNLLLLIFNPLPLFFGCRALRRSIKHKPCRWWKAWAVLIVAGIIGGFVQHYQIATMILAFSLLTRPVLHWYRKR